LNIPQFSPVPERLLMPDSPLYHSISIKFITVQEALADLKSDVCEDIQSTVYTNMDTL
jgi:hypothetical protein